MKIKVGPSFSDSIYTEKTSFVKLKRGYDNHDDVQMRGFIIPVLILVAALFLLGRLFFIQAVHGQEYRLLSDTNRTRTAIIHAPRGIIFDRNNQSMVFNIPGFREISPEGKTTQVDNKTGLTLLTQGKTLEVDSLRDYPCKEACAHVVGYVGQISQEELANVKVNTYQPKDVIGKMGIEQSYETDLKGIDGQRLIEVDATGKYVRTLGQTEPIPGRNIVTTLDMHIQEVAYDAMKDVKKGAVVVSKPDGEIIALVSKPSFDPNMFTQGDHYERTADNTYSSVEGVLLDSENQPLLDRSISGTYPPGSTFKIVTAAAALESKKIDSSYTVDDTGILKVGDFSFANWYFTEYGRTEGLVNVVSAIKRSNDIFFYKVGELVGVDTLSAIAEKFGVGQKLGIDLFGEKSGLLPTKEWKKKELDEQWYLGDDYHYAIGQGYLLTTPLQVNAWTQAIANGGTLYQPHLLLNQNPRVLSQHLLKKENFELIRQGMIEACQTGGVAWPLFNFGVKQSAGLTTDGKDFYDMQATVSANTIGVTIACKTGTAQHGGEDTLPHAWITLFAPAYHPQIVVTVLSESSGEGSNVAAPVAKKILDAYFSK